MRPCLRPWSCRPAWTGRRSAAARRCAPPSVFYWSVAGRGRALTCLEMQQAPVQPGVPPTHARLAAAARAQRASGPSAPGPRKGRPGACAHAAPGANCQPGQCACRCHACHNAHALSLVHKCGQPACMYGACVTLSGFLHEAVHAGRGNWDQPPLFLQCQ